jgi:hypothetical protein
MGKEQNKGDLSCQRQGSASPGGHSGTSSCRVLLDRPASRPRQCGSRMQLSPLNRQQSRCLVFFAFFGGFQITLPLLSQVAYAYLQGESTNSGRLDDASMVTQVCWHALCH